MQFNSISFVLFFIPVLMAYHCLRHRAQNYFLLVASYIFYGWWDWRFTLLIFASTMIDYVCAQGMTLRPNLRRPLLFVSVITNLLILGYFKYCNFFVDSMVSLLAQFGLTLDWTTANILLPVGISFYTFQSLSYTIDVFRGDYKATKNVFDFALYVAFFPQLVAGPIERVRDLLPQIEKERLPTYLQIAEGAWLVLYGYFVKVVVADNLQPFVKRVFDTPAVARGTEIPLGAFAALIMIYSDFAGYSNIARGIARLMGFRLSQNFKFPVFALNPQDFWQRWHLTLMYWFRDYVYRPLLGLSRSHWLALLLTFGLVGLWHGAAANFVAWGIANGISLWLFHKLKWLWRPLRIPTPLAVLLHILWSCLIMSLFFLEHPSDLLQLLNGFILEFEWTGFIALETIVMIVLPFLMFEAYLQKHGEFVILQHPRWRQFAVYAAIYLSILTFGVTNSFEFIYFQF